jgi:hypothetical protein
MRQTSNEDVDKPFNMVDHMEQDIGLDAIKVDIGSQPEFGDDELQSLRLAKESRVPLYIGSDLNKLTGTLMLLDTCVIHQVNNGFVDDLFSLLCNSILPRPNLLQSQIMKPRKYNTIFLVICN